MTRHCWEKGVMRTCFQLVRWRFNCPEVERECCGEEDRKAGVAIAPKRGAPAFQGENKASKHDVHFFFLCLAWFESWTGRAGSLAWRTTNEAVTEAYRPSFPPMSSLTIGQCEFSGQIAMFQSCCIICLTLD